MKAITAQELLNVLLNLEKEGNDLSSIHINFRTNSDSDVEVCTYVGEDLYDESTNSRLESLVLMADSQDN